MILMLPSGVHSCPSAYLKPGNLHSSPHGRCGRKRTECTSIRNASLPYRMWPSNPYTLNAYPISRKVCRYRGSDGSSSILARRRLT